MMGRRLCLAAAGLLAGAADPDPIRVPPVSLRDHRGQFWALRELVTAQAVLLGFFFVRCTTLCPPQTAAMQAVQAELAGRPGAASRPLLLSVALDPLGDTPDAITGYARQFGIRLGRAEGWLMLTGSHAELSRVWSAFGTPGGARDDHPSVFWLGGPGRSWVRASAATDPARLAAALAGTG